MLMWANFAALALGTAPAPDQSAIELLKICDVPHAQRARCYGAVMNSYDLAFPDQPSAIRSKDLGLDSDQPMDKPKFDIVISRYLAIVRETPTLRFTDALPL